MALMGLGFASFAVAVVKLIANTTLLGNPDVNTLLFNGIRIAIWNSIENDFVLSAAFLPTTPPFFRVCKAFVETHVTTSTRSINPISFKFLKKSGRPCKYDDNLAIELAHNGELPGTWESKLRSEEHGLG
ncbi:MAG: hypothetical protein Q9167_006524 [Letrouitia subvulpina]